MKKQTLLYFLGILSIFFWFGGCQQAEKHPHNHEEPEPAGMDEDHHDDEVALTKEQIQKVGLKLGTFENKNLQSTLKVNGLLELPPQNKASVSPLTEGKVIRIHVKPGQYVSRGAILATLQNPEFINWQQQYLEVKGELKYLDKEYDRQKELVEKEIAPQRQLDKIESERIIALAKLKGLQSRMNVIGIELPDNASTELKTTVKVHSPISGFVRDIKVNTGVYVDPNQELFEIVDNRHLHIDFMVFEKDLPYIKNGQTIEFNLQSKPREVMYSKVFAIGKALDEEQRTISVHAEIVDEKEALVPGMYVEGRVILEDQKTPALPEEAVALDNGLYYIFVKEEEHGDETHFKKVPVLKVNADFGYVQVDPLEQLEEDEEIVTEGAYFLMAQTKKGQEGAGGHHH